MQPGEAGTRLRFTQCSKYDTNSIFSLYQHLFNVHLRYETYECNKLMEQQLDMNQSYLVSIAVNAQRIKAFMQVIADVSLVSYTCCVSCGGFEANHHAVA